MALALMGAHILVTPVHSSFKFLSGPTSQMGFQQAPRKGRQLPLQPESVGIMWQVPVWKGPSSWEECTVQTLGTDPRAFSGFPWLLGIGCLSPAPLSSLGAGRDVGTTAPMG